VYVLERCGNHLLQRFQPRTEVVLQVQLAQLRLIQGQHGVLGWPVG
jgi:hypothetical protein